MEVEEVVVVVVVVVTGSGDDSDETSVPLLLNYSGYQSSFVE